jgi:hypothetical protein
LARVQGLRGLASRAATIGGSPLGGLAMALGGPSCAFAVAGTLFAVSLPLLIAVRIAPLPGDDRAAGTAGTAWRDLADGLRHIRRDRVLAPLVIVLAIGDLGFTGPLNIGLTLLAGERGWGAAGLGWIVGGFGAGAAGASLLLAVRGRLPHAGLVQQGCLALGAAAIGALAFAPSLSAAVGVGVAIGLTAGLSGALCAALLQTAADPAYLGRVTAVASLFSFGVAPLTYPLTGAAVAAWGTRPVFAASAAIVALGSGRIPTPQTPVVAQAPWWAAATPAGLPGTSPARHHLYGALPTALSAISGAFRLPSLAHELVGRSVTSPSLRPRAITALGFLGPFDRTAVRPAQDPGIRWEPLDRRP